MSYDVGDTIVALASAPGGAARGVVRVSGPDAVRVAERVFLSADGVPLGEITGPTVIAGEARAAGVAGDMHFPCDLYLWPGRRSYTRQPVAELHTLGSPPLLEALVDGAIVAGARAAEPGEFTLRAFLAGRIDLPQAEAVLGVIDARGEADLDVALRQLAGGVSRRLSGLRADLLDLLADLEAGLDFVDEDIEFVSAEEVGRRLRDAQRHVAELRRQLTSRREGPGAARVVLAGRPNTGKSSLFNALVERWGDAESTGRSALVSPEVGTTRDYVTAWVVLDGVRCELVDTAGVDAHLAEPIDRAAQTASTEQQRAAELVVRCVPVSQEAGVPLGDGLTVGTMADLAVGEAEAGLCCSAMTGEGLDVLARAIAERLTSAAAPDCVASTAARSAESLSVAERAITGALELPVPGCEELVAAELRVALHEIGRLVGEVHSDDVLDVVFGRFCIGK